MALKLKDDREKKLAAAVLGISNMGMMRPDPQKLYEEYGAYQFSSERGFPPTLENIVDGFVGGMYEGEEMQSIFHEECRSWLSRVYDTPDEIEKYHGDVIKMVHDARPKRWAAAKQIDEGAVNPVAVSHALWQATKEARMETFNVANDPAVRLIAHQLAHILNLRDFETSLLSYKQVAEEVREKAKEFQDAG